MIGSGNKSADRSTFSMTDLLLTAPSSD